MRDFSVEPKKLPQNLDRAGYYNLGVKHCLINKMPIQGVPNDYFLGYSEQLARQEKLKEREKLKDCPFCGSKPEISRYKDHGKAEYFYVICKSSCSVRPHTYRCPTEKESIEKWNERPHIYN